MEREEINNFRTKDTRRNSIQVAEAHQTEHQQPIRRKEETTMTTMEWRRESLKWRETWETRRLEENALKTWVWVDNAMQLFKRRPMQQLSNTTSPCATFAL
jgi:hypothetical protein